jgi:hypothetical protein
MALGKTHRKSNVGLNLSVMGYLERAGLLDPGFAIHLNRERSKHLHLDRLALRDPPCPRKSNLSCGLIHFSIPLAFTSLSKDY